MKNLKLIQKTVATYALLILATASVVQAAPNRDQVTTKILATTDGTALKGLLGDAAAKAVVELVIDHNLKASFPTATEAAAVTNGSGFVDIENKNIKAAKAVVDGLTTKLDAGTLKSVIDANIMAPASYGVATGDSEAVKASKWINNASNSTKGNAAEITAVAKILEEAVKMTTLSSTQHLATLNKVLVNSAPTPAPRSIVLGSPLPSSVAGARMLELAITELAKKNLGGANRDWTDVAGYLFGTLIRCHGYVDGNGRTARAAYALALLKGKVPFKAITPAGETALHGLPGQF